MTRSSTGRTEADEATTDKKVKESRKCSPKKGGRQLLALVGRIQQDRCGQQFTSFQSSRVPTSASTPMTTLGSPFDLG